MDNSNGRPSSAAAIELQHQEQQQQLQRQAHAALGGARSRSIYSLGPETPSATGDSSAGYFDTAASLRPQASRQSVRSTSHLSGVVGPHGESRPASRNSNRRPSIRIRRLSNASSLNPQDADVAAVASSSSDALAAGAGPSLAQHGRPRSISQPMLDPAARDADAARHSRRAPQIAMPRLTEEGSRPTMQELGIAGSPLSPTASLPENTTQQRPESLDTDPSASQRNSRRRFSRMFWPSGNGAARRRSQDAASRGSRASMYQDDEYDEHLVDLLDTIGTLPRCVIAIPIF